MKDTNHPEEDYRAKAFGRTGPLVFHRLHNREEHLSILFSCGESPFGSIMVASTNKGICHMAFIDSQDQGLSVLNQKFPGAHLQSEDTPLHGQALNFFSSHPKPSGALILHVKGTEFQIQVWNQLLHIPLGTRTTYGAIARQLGHPKAARAVGTAIGSNPVALLIPCHRVVQASGKTGGYRWGKSRKEAILNWETTFKENHEPLIFSDTIFRSGGTPT
jgi:AraC family transcriptional regulator of adaptative response/methylated-DNA-[protein]-cysteine methyltransferase